MGVRYIQFYVYGLLSTNVMRLSKQKILMWCKQKKKRKKQKKGLSQTEFEGISNL